MHVHFQLRSMSIEEVLLNCIHSTAARVVVVFKQCNSSQSCNGGQLPLDAQLNCTTSEHGTASATWRLLCLFLIGLRHCLTFSEVPEHTRMASAASFCPCCSLYLEALVFSVSFGWPCFCLPGYSLTSALSTDLPLCCLELKHIQSACLIFSTACIIICKYSVHLLIVFTCLCFLSSSEE